MARKVVSRATYWRRRVVVLAACVAVLGLPIWAVNQALGGSRGQGSLRSNAGTVASAQSRAGHGHQQAPTSETADLGSRPRPSADPRGAGAALVPGEDADGCGCACGREPKCAVAPVRACRGPRAAGEWAPAMLPAWGRGDPPPRAWLPPSAWFTAQMGRPITATPIARTTTRRRQ